MSIGYLHAYRFKEDAEYYVDHSVYSKLPLRVVEMYVPEGEEYYSNEFEIAAHALFWDEIIDQ